MKVKHGKLLTNQREQLVQDYKMRRSMWQGVTEGIPMRTLLEPREDYMRWVRDFERFMCRGLEADDVVRVAVRGQVAHEAPGIQQPTLEDASRPDASVAQVD